jgi:CheY-like chemotaxis protein
MKKDLKDLNILIVEDESKNTEILERILLGQGITKLRTASNTEEAIDKISQDLPDLILLDLRIPYTEGGQEDAANSYQIVLEVESSNRIHDHHIKIIIISGTTQEKGLQKLIAKDKSLFQHMFDKGDMGMDPEKFKNDLLAQIKQVLTHSVKKNKPKISLFENLDRIIAPLKQIDKDLFAYFHDEVLCNFEEMDDKTENIVSQAIIIRCGIILEDLIQQFENPSQKNKDRKFNAESSGKVITEIIPEDEKSIKRRLEKLTGRTWDKTNYLYIINDKAKISRQACEYGVLAYKCRNHASHSNKTNPKNDNIFNDGNFTKEHAINSITLLTPILQDYIKYKSK